jgi:hypothetical protein
MYVVYPPPSLASYYMSRLYSCYFHNTHKMSSLFGHSYVIPTHQRMVKLNSLCGDLRQHRQGAGWPLLET